jgi:2-phosphosulfolactate phosphatase
MPDNKYALKKIEVCFSPALLPLFDIKDTIVVVIDVLRATSTICNAFKNGATHIVPLKTVEEGLSYREKGYIIAAERNGEMIPGFDFGNSPFSYSEENIKGKKIAFTTTNGTQAIDAALGAAAIVIGSFLNLDALSKWLLVQNKNVICLCSGWQNKFNLEDSLFAGAVVENLLASGQFSCTCDSSLAAQHLYHIAKEDMFLFLENSSHRKRLERLNIEKDIAFCLTPNQTNAIPVLIGNKLLNMA